MPGVQAAAPRYEVQAVDSFSLGETIDVIAYPGDHTIFEAPPLTAGHRLKGLGEAEVGAGPGGRARAESGIDAGDRPALGRRAAAARRGHRQLARPRRPSRLHSRRPRCCGRTRRRPSRSRFACTRALTRRRSALRSPRSVPCRRPASGATARGVPLVDTLRTLLRAVAIVDGLVCLYALIQTCALTLQERRRDRRGAARDRSRDRCGPSAARRRRARAGDPGRRVRHPDRAARARAGARPPRRELRHAGARRRLRRRSPLWSPGCSWPARVAVLWVTRQATRETVVEGLART